MADGKANALAGFARPDHRMKLPGNAIGDGKEQKKKQKKISF
jgi:hypothetical protein